MIASLVVTLDRESPELSEAIGQISTREEIEVGDLIDGYRLPVTIEASKKAALDEITRWLQGHKAVAFVDVVFVHFEDEPNGESNSAPQMNSMDRKEGAKIVNQ